MTSKKGLLKQISKSGTCLSRTLIIKFMLPIHFAFVYSGNGSVLCNVTAVEHFRAADEHSISWRPIRSVLDNESTSRRPDHSRRDILVSFALTRCLLHGIFNIYMQKNYAIWHLTLFTGVCILPSLCAWIIPMYELGCTGPVFKLI